MPMQKIINEPKAFVDEMLEGILLAHPESLRARPRGSWYGRTLPFRAKSGSSRVVVRGTSRSFWATSGTAWRTA